MKKTYLALLLVGIGIVGAIGFALRGDDPRSTNRDAETAVEERGATRFLKVLGAQPTEEAATAPDSPNRREVEAEKAPLPAAEPANRHSIVRVVDARGEGVSDCPIRVGCEGGASLGQNAMLQNTDSQGRVRFPETNFLQTFGEIAEDARFVFDIGLPLRERVSVRASWRDVFDNDIELRAPGLGAVEIEVTRLGAPFVGPATIELEITFESAPWLSIADPQIGTTRFSAPLETGRARVGPLPLGLRFWPNVRLPSGVVSPADPLAGPALDGEVVLTRIDLEASPYLSFRLVDGAGNVVANEPITVTKFDFGAGRPSYALSEHVESDVEGRCIVQWSAPFLEGGSRTLIVAIGPTSSRGPTEIERAGTATRKFSEAFSPGRNDLGELRLVPPALLVAGRVVDASGDGIAGAVVFLEQEPGPSAAPWFYRPTSKTTDDAGHFEFFGEPTSPGATVHATATGYEHGERISFASGVADLTLTLRRGSRVSGRFILPGFVPASCVRARLTRNEIGDSSPTRESTVTPESDGTFEFLGISSGGYEFSVDAGPRERAIVIAGIAVPPDESVADPRLADLSLSGLLREIRVVVADRDGAPIAGAQVSVEGPSRRFEEPRTPIATSDPNGHARLLISSEGQTVVASAEGFRPAWRDDVRTDVEFELSKALTVVLRARGDEPLAARNRTLCVALEPISGPGFDAGARAGTSSFASQPFSNAREARFVIPFPGRYRVQWSRTESAPNVSMSISIGGDQEIELFDVASTQLVEIDPPGGGLDEH